MVTPGDRTTIGSAIIYCHDMASATPREFLPLPAGGIHNYASMSKLQSSKWLRCYSDRIYSGHGYTEFKMVRVVLANTSQASSYACSWSYDQTEVPSLSEWLIFYKTFPLGQRNVFFCGCYSTFIAYNVYHYLYEILGCNWAVSGSVCKVKAAWLCIPNTYHNCMSFKLHTEVTSSALRGSFLLIRINFIPRMNEW